MASDPQDLIDAANKPKMVSGDEGSYNLHSLRDQIEAHEYADRKKASNKRSFRSIARACFAFRTSPPGGRGF